MAQNLVQQHCWTEAGALQGCNVCWVGNYTAGTGDKGKSYSTELCSLYRKLFRDRWLQRIVILRDETLPFACVCVCRQTHRWRLSQKAMEVFLVSLGSAQAVSCGSEQECVKRDPHLPSSHSPAQDFDDDVKSNVHETALEIMLWDSSHITEGAAGFLCGPEK